MLVAAASAMIGVAVAMTVPPRMPGLGRMMTRCVPPGVMTRRVPSAVMSRCVPVGAAMLRMARVAGAMMIGMLAVMALGVILMIIAVIVIIDVAVDGPRQPPPMTAILIPLAGNARPVVSVAKHGTADAVAGFRSRENRKRDTGDKQQHDSQKERSHQSISSTLFYCWLRCPPGSPQMREHDTAFRAMKAAAFRSLGERIFSRMRNFPEPNAGSSCPSCDFSL